MLIVKKIRELGLLTVDETDAVAIQKESGVTGYALLSDIGTGGGGASVGVSIDGGNPTTVYNAPTLMIDFGGIT